VEASRLRSRSSASRIRFHWRMVYAASSRAYCILRTSTESTVILVRSGMGWVVGVVEKRVGKRELGLKIKLGAAV